MSSQRHAPLLFTALAVAVCTALVLWSRGGPQIRPEHDAIPARIEGQFLAGSGWFPGEPFVTAKPVQAWGSWAGDDAHTGTLTLGPFRASDRVRFGVSGYPTRGIELHLQNVATGERRRIEHPDVGERWRIAEHILPPSWHRQPLLLVAADRGQALGGWVAITEPIRGDRSDGLIPLADTLASWACNTLLFGLLWLAAARIVAHFAPVPVAWLPLAATAAVAFAGYVAFWAYFAHPLLGRVVSIAFAVVALLMLWRHRSTPISPEHRHALRDVARLGLITSVFYLALLHLFPSSLDFYSLAANRFRHHLPVDNQLPFAAADRLYRGEPLRQPDADWLSSDRPPLQTGWQLLALPFMHTLALEPESASGTAAVWLQLAWIAAAYGLFAALGLAPRRACAWIAVLSLSGFFLQNTVYTWPKLSAAAFATATFALLFFPSQISNFKSQIPFAAFLAALAWLSHGGVAFSFLPLVPWLAWRMFRLGRSALGHWSLLLRPALLFVALTLPWIAYQKFYDPPGNRLLKWHLGGQIDKDARGTLQTIRENYAKLSWTEIFAAKRANFAHQIGGHWSGLLETSADHIVPRRNDEFYHTGRAFGWWLLGLVALPIAFLRRSPLLAPSHFSVVIWIAVTIPLWCLLMFAPSSAIVHQGSYAVMLCAFVLLSTWLEAASRFALALIAVLQAIAFFTTWAPASPIVGGAAHPLAASLAAVAGLALAALIVHAFRPTRPDAASAAEVPLAPRSQPC